MDFSCVKLRTNNEHFTMTKNILKENPFPLLNNKINKLSVAKDITRSNETLEFAPGINLKIGFIHEVCGPSNFLMAMMIASKTEGLIIWVHESSKIPYPDGISSWFSPKRVILVKVSNSQELIWTIEESLRIGLGFLIIGDTETIPNYTSIHRLKLIIKKHHIPLKQSLPTVLILTKYSCELMGVESRWHCSPMKDLHVSEEKEIYSRWKLTCQYSKHEIGKTWIINECENPDNPFSFFKKKKKFSLTSQKVSTQDI